MRLIRLALIVIVLLAIVAALTRPGPAEFDAMLDAAIRERVANTELDASGAPLPTIALAACKMRPTDCVSLVRDTLDVTFEEGIFVTRATVEGFGRTATCRGAFGRFVCDREVAG